MKFFMNWNWRGLPIFCSYAVNHIYTFITYTKTWPNKLCFQGPFYATQFAHWHGVLIVCLFSIHPQSLVNPIENRTSTECPLCKTKRKHNVSIGIQIMSFLAVGGCGFLKIFQSSMSHSKGNILGDNSLNMSLSDGFPISDGMFAICNIF